MMTYPFIRKGTVVLVGQSTGGLASLALTIRWPRMAKSVILFAAGSGGHAEGIANQNCAPERLIRMIQDFGAKIRIPTLWMYVRNDTYFGPELSRRMVDAFRSSGGLAEYHVFPAFSDEGHFFIHSPQAIDLWSPALKAFLMRNN
jgi:pimeloyl-ACP methyl ester carboxylesterase